MKNARLNHPKAFTLVETILAITVMTLVIVTVSQLTQGSIKIGGKTARQFVAYHLAEEGLEIVRNMRDSNWLRNQPWNTGLESGIFDVSAATPGLGTAPFTLTPYADASLVPEIVLSESEKFRRYVEITVRPAHDSAPDILRVTSHVRYQEGDGEKTADLTMELTDWKQGPL